MADTGNRRNVARIPRKLCSDGSSGMDGAHLSGPNQLECRPSAGRATFAHPLGSPGASLRSCAGRRCPWTHERGAQSRAQRALACDCRCERTDLTELCRARRFLDNVTRRRVLRTGLYSLALTKPSRCRPWRNVCLVYPVTIPRAKVYCTPRRRRSVPRPAALRRRYPDAPAAALLTGLGAGEWLRCSALRRFAILPLFRELRGVPPLAVKATLRAKRRPV